MRPTDFSPTSPSTCVSYIRDEENVMVRFWGGTQKLGRPQFFTHAQAIGIGTRVAATGSYEDCPVDGLTPEALKSFGVRLKQYGEN